MKYLVTNWSYVGDIAFAISDCEPDSLSIRQSVSLFVFSLGRTYVSFQRRLCVGNPVCGNHWISKQTAANPTDIPFYSYVIKINPTH